MDRSKRAFSSSRSRGCDWRRGSLRMIANARSRARRTSAMSSANLASLRSGMPDCFVSNSVPSPRSFEILVGEREPVGRAHHRVDAGACLPVLLVGAVEQDAVRCVRPSPDASPQLMQLGEPESLGVLHEHHRGVRDVDPHLDHRGRDQQVRVAGTEALHDGLLVPRSHPPMQEVDPQLGEDLGRQPLRLRLGRLHLGTVPLVDGGADDEGLPARGDLTPHQLIRVGPLSLGAHGSGLDGLPPLGELVQHHHIQ